MGSRKDHKSEYSLVRKRRDPLVKTIADRLEHVSTTKRWWPSAASFPGVDHVLHSWIYLEYAFSELEPRQNRLLTLERAALYASGNRDQLSRAELIPLEGSRLLSTVNAVHKGATDVIGDHRCTRTTLTPPVRQCDHRVRKLGQELKSLNRLREAARRYQ